MASVSRESALCDFPFRRERQNSFRTSRKCEVDSSGVPSVSFPFEVIDVWIYVLIYYESVYSFELFSILYK